MRILTVRQPWAHAIIHLGKDVENRSRNIAGGYRGPVAIHAAKSALATFHHRHADLWPFDRSKHALGVIIGVVELVDVHSHSGIICTPWAFLDEFHMMLANPRALSVPIPYKGALGLRTLPDEVAEQINNTLETS